MYLIAVSLRFQQWHEAVFTMFHLKWKRLQNWKSFRFFWWIVADYFSAVRLVGWFKVKLIFLPTRGNFVSLQAVNKIIINNRHTKNLGLHQVSEKAKSRRDKSVLKSVGPASWRITSVTRWIQQTERGLTRISRVWLGLLCSFSVAALSTNCVFEGKRVKKETNAGLCIRVSFLH